VATRATQGGRVATRATQGGRVATFSTHQDSWGDSNWMKEKIEMIKCRRHQFGEIDETSFKILSLNFWVYLHVTSAQLGPVWQSPNEADRWRTLYTHCTTTSSNSCNFVGTHQLKVIILLCWQT